MSNRKPRSQASQPHLLEPLEKRVLLTTLFGGESFTWVNAKNGLGNIRLGGDIIVELIFLEVDNNNFNAELAGSAPGFITESTLGRVGEVLGGLPPDPELQLGLEAGLPAGVQLLSEVNIVDPIVPAASVGPGDAPSNRNNIRAFASRQNNGATYGINVQTVSIAEEDVQFIQIVEFDPLTGDGVVVAHLQDQLPTDDDGNSLVTSIQAADFFPVDDPVTPLIDESGRLYFVASTFFDPEVDENPVEVLFYVDIDADGDGDADTNGDIQASLTQMTGTFSEGTAAGGLEREVTSIAFDRTGPASADMWVSYVDLDGPTPQGFIGQVQFFPEADPPDNPNVGGDPDVANTNFLLTSLEPTFFDMGVAEPPIDAGFFYTAIAFPEDDPTQAEEFVIGISVPTGNAASQIVWRTDLSTGLTRALATTRQDVGQQTPRNFQGVAFNPFLTNPFTGEEGALIGFDIDSDEIYLLDYRVRLQPADLFAIYVTHAGANASIAIWNSVMDDDELVVTPFNNGPGRVLTQVPGEDGPLVIDNITTAGTVWIGARTEDAIGGTDIEEDIPIIRAELLETIGARAVGVNDFPEDDLHNLSAGLFVPESVLDFLSQSSEIAASTLGDNLDTIGAIAVSRETGEIVVVDVDGVDVNGLPLAGQEDQVARVSRTTGQSISVETVTGLSQIQGLSFADVDRDGSDDLYAVYDAVLGLLDPDTGVFTPIDDLENVGDLAGSTNVQVKSIAFLGENRLFMLADDDFTTPDVDGAGNEFYKLYEVEFAQAGGVITGITNIIEYGPVIDSVTGAAMQIGGIAFNRAGQLFANDLFRGRLVDLDLTAGPGNDVLAGAFVATADGSLRPTVADLALDFQGDRLLGADNITGALNISNENGLTNSESASIVVILGTSSNSAQAQSMDVVLIAGTITGRVDISGSIDTFYVGWLITGDALGQLTTEVGDEIAENFRIGGDIRSLIVSTWIGMWESSNDILPLVGEPEYFSGVDIVVGGKIGLIYSLNSIGAAIFADNQDAVPSLNSTQPIREIEKRFFIEDEDATPEDLNGLELSAFMDFTLFAADGRFINDTLGRAQRLGSLRSPNPTEDDVIIVNGTLEPGFAIPDFPPIAADEDLNDEVDIFAVALLAGQTVRARVESGFGLPVHLAVYDPEGRLIHTDYVKNPDEQDTLIGTTIEFTADRPGEYYFAIGEVLGSQGIRGADNFLIVEETYQLTIEGAGDIAIGGIVTLDNLLVTPEAPITARRGAIGSIRASNAIYGTGSDEEASIFTTDGDIRSVVGGDIGHEFSETIGGDDDGEGGLFGFTFIAPSIRAGGGSIGLIQSMINNTPFLLGDGGAGEEDNGLVFEETTFLESPEGDHGLLGALNGFFSADVDIQIIDSGGDVSAIINAGRALGTLRAFSLIGGEINVNSDGVGNDGRIDLIDLRGDLGGAFELLRPVIRTGFGGNVRYIRVQGDVYQDPIFDLVIPSVVEFDPGENFVFRDDSGARINLRPVGLAFDPDAEEDEEDEDFEPEQARMIIRQFAIRDSGGAVLISVGVNGSLNISGDGFGNNSPAEISEILIAAEGRMVTTPPQAEGEGEEDEEIPPLSRDLELSGGEEDDEARDLNLIISGQTPIDVYSVIAASSIDTPNGSVPLGTGAGGGEGEPGDEFTVEFEITTEGEGEDEDGVTMAGGSFTRFINNTGGEIVNAYIGTVARFIYDGNIGIAKQSTASAVLGQPRFVNDDGEAGEPNSQLPYPFNRQRNAIVVGNTLNMRSNMAIGNVVTHAIGGEDGLASIVNLVANADGVDDPFAFEGIAGPIFAFGDIVGVGIGEGIAFGGRGDVAFAGLFAEGFIGDVRNDGEGSDVNGDIVAGERIESIVLTDGVIIEANIMITPDFLQSRDFIDGLATFIPGEDDEEEEEDEERDEELEGELGLIDRITLNGTGGIIGSFIGTAGRVGNISVNSGFGIFTTFFFYGTEMGNVSADGFGIRSVSIRGGKSMGDLTATGKGDPLSILVFSPSVRRTEFEDVAVNRLNDLETVLGTRNEMTGIIENTLVTGLLDLGTVSAYQIRNAVPNDSERGFFFANSIAGIITIDDIIGVDIVTGALFRFQPGADVIALNMTVAGELKKVQINGDLAGNSVITVNGPNGIIKKFTVLGDMDGSLFVAGIVGKIDIRGNLTGTIEIIATNPDATALKGFKLAGDYSNGSLDIVGSVGKIDVLGDFGIMGDSLTITGDLKSLKVGGGSSFGSTMGIEIIILGSLGKFDATGRVLSPISVFGDVKKFDISSGTGFVGATILAADVTILGEVKNVSIDGGDVASSFLVAFDISKFAISDGSLLAGASVGSFQGDIGKFDIKTGDLLGDLNALAGVLGKITIKGSDVGGEINALALDSLSLDGSILTTSRINITNGLSKLDVGMDIEAGAEVNAGFGESIDVGRDLLGDITFLKPADKGTGVSVGRDLGGDVDINSDVDLEVGRDLLDSSTVNVRRNLDSLDVEGIVSGDVIVDGFGDKWEVGGTNGALFTVAFDLASFKSNGDVIRTLIQAGMSAGDDGIFGATTGDKDQGEESRRGMLEDFEARDVTDSVIAAGGNFGGFSAQTMTNSSASSGVSVGSFAAAAFVADLSPLATVGEQDAARSGGDRRLTRGNFDSFDVVTMINSDATAGVDAGPDGAFGTGDDTLLFQNPESPVIDGGGRSTFGSVSVAGSDAASNILADTGIDKPSIVGAANVNTNVTYALEDLADANPIAGETLVGTATAVAPVVYVTSGGHTVTITVSGVGSVALRDEGGADTDDRLGTFIVSGTDDKTVVSVTTSTPGAVSIGRILTADDARLDAFITDAPLAGDDTADTDMFLDGGVSDLVFQDLDDNFAGVVGSDVDVISMRTQRSGVLRVSGVISELNIVDGDGNALSVSIFNAPTGDVTQITVDNTGRTFLFDNTLGTLTEVDPDTGAIIGAPVEVKDNFFDAVGDPTLELLGLDHDGLSDVFLAVARINNVAPTQLLGAMSNGAVALSGLAINNAGEVYAVDSSSGTDTLMRVDPLTGGLTPVGELRSVFGDTYSGDVLQLAFGTVQVGGSFAERLVALVSDIDGDGPQAPGVAIVQIDTTPDNAGTMLVSRVGSPFLPGLSLDGGGVVNDFKGLAIHPTTRDIYAIRRNLGNTQDELVTIDAATGTVTAVGAGVIRLDTDGDGVDDAFTNLVGIGFDDDGNLFGLNDNGVTSEMIGLTAANLGDPTRFELVTREAALPASGLDAFTIAKTGAFPAFAYDTDAMVGAQFGAFFTSQGTASTLGTLDVATGKFTQVAPLAQDAMGTLLESEVASITVDHVADLVYAVTEDGTLLSYNRITGQLVTNHGQLRDAATGLVVQVDSIQSETDGLGNGTGDLVGVDRLLNRLVTIDPVTGTVAARTEPGTAPVTFVDIAFDPVLDRFISFNDSTDNVVAFTGTTQAALRGITADSIEALNITGGTSFSSRIAANGNTIEDISILGNFFGTLTTPFDIEDFSLVGDFGGTLFAGRIIDNVQIIGEFLEAGLMQAVDALNDLEVTGLFNGKVVAGKAESFEFGGVPGGVANMGQVVLSSTAGDVFFAGDFGGSFTSFGAETFEIEGDLLSGAWVLIHGATDSVAIEGDAELSATVYIGGPLDDLTVGGMASALFAIDLGLGGAQFGSTDQLLLVVGRNTGKVRVDGNAVDSIFSFGTTIGEDLLYNTADDRITGGSVDEVDIQGDMFDTVVAAGVLPSVSQGPGRPANSFAFTGNTTTQDVTQGVDAAEAGGPIRSFVHSLKVGGRTINTNAAGGAFNAVVAADGIFDLDLGAFLPNLRQRVYGDPIGAPSIISAQGFNAGEFRVVFSEEINTDSIVLSVDFNNDGDLDDPGDVDGTVSLIDANGNFIDEGISLFYTTQIGANGQRQGVLRIISDGFDENIDVLIDGGTPMDPGMFDRSGIRSLLRDFNGDPFGTLVDGDGDGIEGGTRQVTFVNSDLPNSFVDATLVPAIQPVLDFGPTVIVDSLTDGEDIDVIRFNANAGDFFSAMAVAAEASIEMALFFQDDQGTPNLIGDDRFELVARHDSVFGGGELYQAFELPETGQYFLAVNGQTGSQFFFDPTADNTYQLTIELASTVAGLNVPIDEVVAFVNNVDNVPKQLVYINFEGGTARMSEFEELIVDVDFDAFDARTLDPSVNGGFFDSDTDLLIDGGAGVTSILDNIITIFTTLLPGQPGFDVTTLSEVDLASITGLADLPNGLSFTLVDPTTVAGNGLTEDEYTELIIGEANDELFGGSLLGLASQVDIANMDKGDQVLVFSNSFTGLATGGSRISRLNRFSVALANVASREIGHALGLNSTELFLVSDDPDNDGDTTDLDFSGFSLLAAQPNLSSTSTYTTELFKLGTSLVERGEFSIGWIDTAAQLNRWLS